MQDHMPDVIQRMGKGPNGPFPLAMQMVLPSRYWTHQPFRSQLEALRLHGFSGVELNMAHPDQVEFSDLQDFLHPFHLTCTCLASGLTAKTHGLSLCIHDPEIRNRSVERCQQMIDRISGTGVGLIIGFLKGAPGRDPREDRECFLDSLHRISPLAAERKVRVLIEATNRYEASVANTLEETVNLIQGFENPYLRILPDTFHMNIEEAEPSGVLKRFAPWYDSIHLSDNNRHFPGFGAINFAETVAALKAGAFQGSLAVEGNLRDRFVDDVKATSAYLAPLLG
jgi:sugar phosphate isomerase/epimerase